MTGPQLAETLLDDSYVAKPRGGLVGAEIGAERVIWNRHYGAPAYLEPIAALLWALLDGEVTVGELVDDVVDVIGIEAEIARPRIQGAMQTYRAGGLLTDSPDSSLADDFFPFPPSH
ncbi:MAG: PqqD family protein [Actinomycetia bacterium]|nr:PqqD family protein [Actinomycetes bacterium]